MGKSYNPRPGSLAARLIFWLSRNPDEELSAQDVALKFDHPEHRVSADLVDAVNASALTNRRGVYGAGPALGEFVGRVQPAKPWKGSHANKGTPLPPLDVSALQVDVDVPEPAAGAGRTLSVYQQLIARLTHKGQSVAVPIAYRRGLLHSVARHNNKAEPGAGRYAVHAVSATECRLFRVE